MVVDLDDSDDDGDAPPPATGGAPASAGGASGTSQLSSLTSVSSGAPASAGGASGMGGGAAAGPSAAHQAELARVQEQARKRERELAALAQRGGSLLRPGEVSGRVDKEPARKRVRWSEAEEAALKDGVQRFGVGNWAEIRENVGGLNAERRPTDLKDKWTNMVKKAARGE